VGAGTKGGGKSEANKETGEGYARVHIGLTFTAKPMVSSDAARAHASGLLWNLLLLDESRFKVRMRAGELGAVPLLLYLISYGDSHCRCVMRVE
jgi:hypothetical protein